MYRHHFDPAFDWSRYAQQCGDIEKEAAVAIKRLNHEKALSDDQSPTKASKAKGGRPGLTEAEKTRRLQLIDDWNRAKEAGESMKGFCSDRGVDWKYLEKCVNWCAQQRRRMDTKL
jgi:hypothetical protein